MKKKLSGLLSLWLAAVMVLGILPMGALADGTGMTPDPTKMIYVYTGNTPSDEFMDGYKTNALSWDDGYWNYESLEPKPADSTFASVKKVELNTEKSLAEQITITSNSPVVGWRVWVRTNSGNFETEPLEFYGENATVAAVTQKLSENSENGYTYYVNCCNVTGLYYSILEPIYGYTVTFNANGGTWGANSAPSLAVKPGSTIECPTVTPSRTGYTFGGWYEESTCENAWVFKNVNTQSSFDPSSMLGSTTTTAEPDKVNSSITLYAKWNPVTYTIIFNGNNGIGTMDNQAYTYDTAGAKLSKNTFTLEDSVFAGWGFSEADEKRFDDEASLKTVVDAAITDNKVANDNGTTNTITLYAVWASDTTTPGGDEGGNEGTTTPGGNEGTTTPGGNEGTTTPGGNEGTIAPDDTDTPCGDPDCDCTDCDCGDDCGCPHCGRPDRPNHKPDDNFMIFPNLRQLSFDVNGGKKIKSVPRALGSTVRLKDYVPEREGYTFAGWYSDMALTKEVTSVVMTGHKTVYAAWEEN